MCEVILTISLLMFQHKEAFLHVRAQDRGNPPKESIVVVHVLITQTVNAYPQWLDDYSKTPIKLSENAPRDYIVKRLKAVSTMIGNPYVNYIIQQGDTPEQNGPPAHFHSRIDEATNEMLLMVYNPLDFEVIPKFTLTIKAAVSMTSKVLTLTVLVATIDAQWEGMGNVGSVRYELALLPTCPTIRVLSYSN